MTPRVAIVGAGVAGLSSARRLALLAAARGSALELVVLEAAARAGGQVGTERTADALLETGADTLVTHKPAGLRLCRELGLEGEIVHPDRAAEGVHVLHRGELVRLPEGFALVAPSRWGPTLRSPLLSWRGKARLLLEPFVAANREAGDESLASFVSRRLGREVLERIAEPVVAGLFTARAEQLSLQLTMPRLLELERAHGSVIRGLRAARAARRRGAAPVVPPFASLAGGLGRLVDALVDAIGADRVRTSCPVEALAPGPAGWRLRTGGGEVVEASAVLLACPAYVAAGLVAPFDAPLSRRLAGVRYASSATVNVVYRRADVGAPLRSHGFFVPRGSGSPLLACSDVSAKFPGRVPADRVLLRAFLGGDARPGALAFDDAALVRSVHAELRSLLALRAEPVLARVHRHPLAMPLFRPGDEAWLAVVRAGLGAHAGLAAAGTMDGAIGVADAIESGERAAEALFAQLAARRDVSAAS